MPSVMTISWQALGDRLGRIQRDGRLYVRRVSGLQLSEFLIDRIGRGDGVRSRQLVDGHAR